MIIPLLDCWRQRSRPVVVGMLHLGPLPGSPRYAGDLERLIERAVRDARALIEGGIDGMLVENLGDAPFFPGRVPPSVVASMSVVARAVAQLSDLPLGVNVLRNDASSALAVAQASGARFIRVNVLAGARLTDQGIIASRAHRLLRERRMLDARHVQLLADVNVKHSAALAPRPLADEVDDLVQRSGADGLIVSGTRTGAGVDLDELREVRAAAGSVPLWVGSGVTPETVEPLLPLADGLIVGTALKRDGRIDQPVDAQRVRALVERCG